MNFNKTAVATFVGAALSTITLGAVAGSNNTILSTYYNAAANSTSTNNRLVAKQQQVQSQAPTISGMSNIYDTQLGKTTFRWANLHQSKPDMGAIAPAQRVSYAAGYYLNQLTGMSATKLSQNRAVLVNVFDQGHGARIAKYHQQVNGVDVFNREYNILMDGEYNLVASSGYLANNKLASATRAVQGAFATPNSSISTAFTDMGGDASALSLVADKTTGQFASFKVESTQGDYGIVGEPRAKKVYYELKGKLIPAYYIEIEASHQGTVNSDSYGYVIGAVTGKILVKHNLTAYDTPFNYRVYADTGGIHKPWQGPMGRVVPAAGPDQIDSTIYLDAPMVTLSSGPISTNDAWLADNATTTQGNNVHAYVDAIAPQGFSNGDYDSAVTSDHTFDYKYDTSLTENAMPNRKAAIVNLFYVNNFLHDWFYDHGFNEASGNGQAVNYGRGGIEGDPINAEAQDNSGFSNANMTTNADGFSPRMQMYLWDSKDAVNGTDYGLTVTSDASIGLLSSTQRSSFGKGQFNVSGNLVRIDDATDVVTDGCEAAINGAALAGNIAIIDRGACNFTLKVKNAQDAGAIAVIVANNRDNTVPAPMGGSDDTVKIPNMGISQDEGAAIYAVLDAGTTVSVDMFDKKLYKGSSWDNAIVAHEWGHYLSNRLIGNNSGLGNQQGGAMGEGWSDFTALLLLANETDAQIPGNETFQKAYAAISYVASFYFGIRKYPYSTDMAVNPYTFKNITDNPEVHAAGTVWATMLWDSYVSLINDPRHSFSEAESLMMDYIVASYKMTPMNPTYTEARDALLSVIYANDVDDYKLVLAAFARRGMGLGAQSPSRFSTKLMGVTESAKTDLAAFTISKHHLNANYAGLTSGYCSNDNILDKGETGTVSFTLKNGGSKVLTGVVGKVEVVSGQNVTFANGGKVTFGDVALFSSVQSNALEFTLNEAAIASKLVLKVTFPDLDPAIQSQGDSFTTTVNMEFKDRPVVSYSSTDNMETVATLHDLSEDVMIGGSRAIGTASLDQTYNFLFPVDKQYLLIQDNPFTSDVGYETRTMTVGYGGDFTISWWQYYELEQNWDGGVVEVSVNGGDWADVTKMGGQFEGLGYIDSISPNSEAAIAGRPAFTGYMPWPGGMETVNFGTGLNGNEVRFRFRISSDSNTSWFGWFIDNLTFTNITTPVFSNLIAGNTYACDNRLPSVSVGSTLNVKGGASVTLTADAVDANGDALTYAWTQVKGPTATLSGADTATISFTAPIANSGADTLTFEVSVNDGTGSVVKSQSVNVTNAPVIVATPKGNSGGGSTGLLALLLLPLIMFRRRKQK